MPWAFARLIKDWGSIKFFTIKEPYFGWSFSQTRPKRPPEMKKKSKTGYTFSTKILEPLEGEGILGAPPCQLLIKSPPTGNFRAQIVLSPFLRISELCQQLLHLNVELPTLLHQECFQNSVPQLEQLYLYWVCYYILPFSLHVFSKIFPGVAMFNIITV